MTGYSAYFFFSSVSILTLLFGTNSTSFIFLAISMTLFWSFSLGRPKNEAKILAPAWINSTWILSLRSSSRGVGTLFNPLQNNFLVYSIMWSGGKALSNCLIWWLKTSWKMATANSTQTSYDFWLKAVYSLFIDSSFPLWVVGFWRCCFFISSKKESLSSKKLISSPEGSAKVPSK